MVIVSWGKGVRIVTLLDILPNMLPLFKMHGLSREKAT
jgi:hypothetical protein